jgi:hypothetical protein
MPPRLGSLKLCYRLVILLFIFHLDFFGILRIYFYLIIMQFLFYNVITIQSEPIEGPSFFVQLAL